MTNRISIEWIYGRPQTGADEDEARAESAALAVLENYDATEVEAEYARQWDEFDDEDKMTGLAEVWIRAQRAADLALTEGWLKANGASCTIHAW